MAELIIISLDRVAGSACDRGDYVALLAEQRVGDGRFANVRLTDYRYSRKVFVRVLNLRLVRQNPDDFIQQIAGAGAIGRRYAIDFTKAQRIELVGVEHLLAAVHFVHAEHDGLLRPTQHVCDLCVVVGHARRGLHHEQDHVGLIDGYLHLLADGALEDVLRVGGVTASVHDRELAAAPFAAAVVAVAGNARGVVHYRLAHSHQTVEQCTFADIRPADYSD